MDSKKIFFFIRGFALIFLTALSAFAQQQPTSCKNSDFSMGNFTNWVGYTSIYPQGTPFSNVPANSYYYTKGIVNGRQTIITNSTPDPFTCGNVQTLPPGENQCVRLGNGGNGPWGNGVGWQRDYLEYTFSITPANALLIYKYAIVLQDPTNDPKNPPHQKEIRPRFITTIMDAAGNLIDPVCGYKEDFADTTVKGFRNCALSDANNLGGTTPNSGDIVYRAWTSVGVDLRKFIGQNITIRFETWDCGLGGHFGYAYLTARCDSLGIETQACTDDGSVTLVAPEGFSYRWLNTGETTRIINIKNAKPGDSATVELTTLTGCKTSVSTVIYPMVTKAKFKLDPPVLCFGNSVTFKDSSYSYVTKDNSAVPIVKWNWNFGDKTSSTAQNPTHTYKVAGDYTVTLRVTNKNGCSDSMALPVKVLPSPLANFTFIEPCINNVVDFIDMSVAMGGSGMVTSWEWTFSDDGSKSNLQYPKHLYTTAGTYSVTLKVGTDKSCVDDTTQVIKIWPNPKASYSASEVCVGDTTAFKDLSQKGDNADNLDKWIWNFGDNSALSSASNPKHFYLKDGTYKTSMIVTTVHGCVSSAVYDVIVHPGPVANFSATPLCLNTPVQFTDLSDPQSVITGWQWLFNDSAGGSSTLHNPTYTYTKPKIYYPQLIVKSKYGCNDTVTVPINIVPLPQVAFDANKYEGCAPLCINFVDLTYSGLDKVVTWNWDFGDGTGSPLQTPDHCYNDPGVYSVSLSVSTANSCKNKNSWKDMIKVYPHPVAGFNINPESTTESDGTITFINTSNGADSWRWDFGDGAFGVDKNPIHIYTKSGTYTVWQYVKNQYNCEDQISKIVLIEPEWNIYVPNAFTPNNKDGKNDGFIPKGHNVTQFQMWIFDRWGDLIYATDQVKDPESAVPWDGRANNGKRTAQEDVYVWLVKVKDIKGNDHRMVGHVTLIR